ncbi:hypothetical protein B7494_g6189 [Chlorociboria aeruginascens]|nr:hypothetical protein B7494_g6189 [Chlorociboria aeruginascens]
MCPSIAIVIGTYFQRFSLTSVDFDILTDLQNYISAPENEQPPLSGIDKDQKPTSLGFLKEIFASPGSSSPSQKLSPEVLINLDPTRVALLIETRPLPHLPALIAHFISLLPPQWTFRFVGVPSSLSLLASTSLTRHIASGKLLLQALPPTFHVSNQEEVSQTLTSLAFYKEFLHPAEWLLVYQADSIICSAAPHSLDTWVHEGYTWLGAPWNLGALGGNGGLSLRHVPPIIELLGREKRKEGVEFEDRWLCDRLQVMNGTKMAPPDVEREFSVESVWFEKPWGYHLRGSGKLLDSEIWSNKTRRDIVFAWCPEVKMILDMDLIQDMNRDTGVGNEGEYE